MRVVSVMNYKGGVGKTTLTANLAAELANRGHRVLMIDLDPQTSLTFSFFSVEEWDEDLRHTRTIKRWYEGNMSSRRISLAELVLTPERVNAIVKQRSGQLDLVASHLGLIDIDLRLAAQLGGTSAAEWERNFLRLHGCLREALHEPAFRDYDLILIDCPPNFGLVTKTAIVASDEVLLPARADYLSTLGIGYLRHSVNGLVAQYNGYADRAQLRRVGPRFAGVVFTMTQRYAGQAILAQRARIDNVREIGDTPVFATTIRNGPNYFVEAGEDGVPPILKKPNDDVSRDMREVTDEFIVAVLGGRHRS